MCYHTKLLPIHKIQKYRFQRLYLASLALDSLQPHQLPHTLQTLGISQIACCKQGNVSCIRKVHLNVVNSTDHLDANYNGS